MTLTTKVARDFGEDQMKPEEISLDNRTLCGLIAALLPEPTKEAIELEGTQDRLANPYGEQHKPKQRSRAQIVAQLRVKAAKDILEAL